MLVVSKMLLRVFFLYTLKNLRMIRGFSKCAAVVNVVATQDEVNYLHMAVVLVISYVKMDNLLAH